MEKHLLQPQPKHFIHFMSHFRVSDVWSRSPRKLSKGYWMAPSHNKDRYCCWWQFQDRRRYNVSFETTAIRQWRREQRSKISVADTTKVSWVWTEPYGCRAHQTNRWWTGATWRLPAQRFPVSAIHWPPSLVLVPRKVLLLEPSL